MPRNTRNRKEATDHRRDLYDKLAHKQQLWWAQADPYITAVLALGDVPASTAGQVHRVVNAYRSLPLHRQWAMRNVFLGYVDHITEKRPLNVHISWDNPERYGVTPAMKGDVRLTFGQPPC